MKIADTWFNLEKIDDRITLIKEPHVSAFAQCNIWHIKGRDADLVIDAGMGVSSLKSAITHLADKPLIAVATHTHFDHIGSSMSSNTALFIHRNPILYNRQMTSPFYAAVIGLKVCGKALNLRVMMSLT